MEGYYYYYFIIVFSQKFMLETIIITPAVYNLWGAFFLKELKSNKSGELEIVSCNYIKIDGVS